MPKYLYTGNLNSMLMLLHGCYVTMFQLYADVKGIVIVAVDVSIVNYEQVLNMIFTKNDSIACAYLFCV